MAQKILKTIGSFFSMTKLSSSRGKLFIDSIDDNFSEIYTEVNQIQIDLEEFRNEIIGFTYKL
jgi:hypothetical protein